MTKSRREYAAPFFFGLLLAVWVCGISPAVADSRGFALPLRAADAPNAPIVEHVELYGASHALVIGIDDYRAGWPRLSNAVKDAKLVAAALKERGFEVTLKTDLSAAEMETAFKEFFVLKGQDPNARLFVWYAGHGHTENGEGYLVPSDAPRPDGATAPFRLKAMSLRRFGDFARLAESKHAFAVFDSCFAGTVFDSARALPPSAVTRATTLPVRQFLTSGDAGQTVSDDGMFRELFLRDLAGQERADANEDGFVTATEIGLYMSTRITNLTRSRQTPRYGKLRDKDWDRGDFVFRMAGAAAEREDPDTVIWRLVDRTGERSGYEAYLRQFPRGRYADAARQKLSALARTVRRTDGEWLRELEAERRLLEAERQRLAEEAAQAKRELAAQRERLAALRAERERAARELAASRPSAPPPEAAAPWHPAGPVAFRGLPVGTEVNYGSWAFRVEESDGLESVIRTRANDFKGFYGAIAILGEKVYSRWGSAAESSGAEQPKIILDTAARRKIDGYWPVTIGKRLEFEAVEESYGGSWLGSLKDTWRFGVVAERAERLRIGGRGYNAIVFSTTASSERGRAYEQEHWYDADSGLILKLIRKWSGKILTTRTAGGDTVPPRPDAVPGEVQRYEILHYVFPAGHAVGAR